jgi:CheY-like chemotaxis protein
MRVLVVDDEPGVAQALRRSLSMLGRRWDVTCAGGGDEAVRILSSWRTDVVVSDFRMPHVDGGDVLAAACDVQPHAVRIVLSGGVDQAAAVATAHLAHRFLAKPCNPDALRRVFLAVESALGSCAADVSPALGMTAPPVARDAVVRLRAALRDDQATVARAADAVRADAALAAKVLQLANSPFFGFGCPTMLVGEAVAHLGLATLARLADAGRAFPAWAVDDVVDPHAGSDIAAVLGGRALSATGLAARGDAAATGAALATLWGLPSTVVPDLALDQPASYLACA